MIEWIRWGLLPVVLGFGLGGVARWALQIDDADPAYAEGIGALVTLAATEAIRQRLEPRDTDT